MDTARTLVLPEELPVAITVNGTGLAVMMATPRDLADFGHGFLRTEGIVRDPSDIEEAEIVDHGERGREVRFWIAATRAEAIAARRRHMAGPVGCGLCGIDSLEEARRAPPSVAATELRVPYSEVAGATEALRTGQSSIEAALHAAACLSPGGGLSHLREDVGRHNALDKTIGAALAAGDAIPVLVVSSRVSVDLVQKCAMAGAAMLIAVSTPTRLAVHTAEAAGMTLVARARRGEFSVYSRPDRIVQR